MSEFINTQKPCGSTAGHPRHRWKDPKWGVEWECHGAFDAENFPPRSAGVTSVPIGSGYIEFHGIRMEIGDVEIIPVKEGLAYFGRTENGFVFVNPNAKPEEYR